MPLNARISLEAQRIIKDAFEDLGRSVSASDRADWDSATLDNVRQAVYRIEEHLAARQSLRNMRRLIPLFDGLAYYSKSIEVLCNGTPYLPWLWAPIKVILKVASDYVEAFDKIIKAYARIAEPLARFKVLDLAYSRSPEVQQPLAIFYADILRFHKEAYQFVRRNGWQILFLSWWGRFQRRFDSIIEDLKEHEGLVDKTANVVHISEAKRMRAEVDTWRQEVLSKLETEEEEQSAARYHAVIGMLKTNELDQVKIFELIAGEALKHPETCDWVTKQAAISAWMRCSQEASFMVLHGHPGTGKSVLATQIARFLQSSEQSLVITHFCTYSYATSADYDEILRSIFAQLIRSNNDLVAHAYQELVLKKKIPSSTALEQLLRDLIPAASPLPSRTKYIHIILDGLDECASDIQTKVITMLERIVATASSSGSTVCKVLLSTRLSPAVHKKLRHKRIVSLSEEKANIERAIRQYTGQRLHSLSQQLSQMDITDTDVSEMESTIAGKADGMFLWARLVLEYLGTNIFFGREEVLSAANSLPRKLSEFYGQILTQLTAHLDERSLVRTRLILGWIAFGKRPLRKAEFRSALAFSAGNPDASELAPPYIFEGFAALIEQRRDSTFAFIHVSVKDFLQSSESPLILNDMAAYYEQGLATATCLLSGFRLMDPMTLESVRINRMTRGLHAFHIYATQYWVEYLLSVASATGGINTESNFFLQSSQLANLLREHRTNVPHLGDIDVLHLSGGRLVHLEPYGDLHTAAAMILLDRRHSHLEESYENDNDVIA
ncbi:NACHT domain-containing protein [Madurella fahalii]|uniref:NACHT domain-containing protein n=1 Tax=Madurella fahalii TaxID=1157608 RepID=A0ABQ0GGV4_9PEZI